MQRFWDKVDKSGDCWEWTSALNNGYGVFSIKNVRQYAHRYSMILDGCDIPSGMHVLHTCDNRKCVNPDHLFLGSNSDNIEDRTIKGRGGRKLCKEDIPRIRDMLRMGVAQTAIAEWFWVTHRVIGRIKNGEIWAHHE